MIHASKETCIRNGGTPASCRLCDEIHSNSITQIDVVDFLKCFAENSISTVITDPPYNWNFMGSKTKWDNIGTNEQYYEWAKQWGTELYRTLKEGGSAFVFGGKRTYHWLAQALKDAGFQQHDALLWIYWCASEDSRVLTKEGFKGIDELTLKDEIATFNTETEEIEYQKPNGINIQKYDGQMLHIDGSYIDQLVTPNHRILFRQKIRTGNGDERIHDGWGYTEARSFHHFSGLQFALAGFYKKGEYTLGNNLAELIGWILTDGHFYNNDEKYTHDIRIYQSSTNSNKVDRIRELLASLYIPFKEYKRERMYKDKPFTEHCFYFSGEWVKKIKEIIPNKKPTNMLLFLKYDELQSLFRGLIGGDGSIHGRNKTGFAFWQKDPETRKWFRHLCIHLGYKTTNNDKKQCVDISLRNYIGMQSKFYQRYVHWEHYTGRVWCPSTLNGNFIAERNGKIFVTGNSGFPKGKYNLKPASEFIFHGVKNPANKPLTEIGFTFHPEAIRVNGENTDGHYPANVFDIPKASKNEKTTNGKVANVHPTVKPIKLLKQLIRLSTNEGDVVVDPFVGSGSTTVAAKELCREFLGNDNDAQSVETARQRVRLSLSECKTPKE